MAPKYGVSAQALSKRLKGFTPPRAKVATKVVTKVDTPKPIPPPRRAPRQTDLEQRFETLEAQLRLERLAPMLDSTGAALGMLFKALKDTKTQGTLKFKPKDFRDIQQLLGKDGFKAAWDYCLANQIIIPEHTLTEEQITRLGVTKTTGGRYVCDYSCLP